MVLKHSEFHWLIIIGKYNLVATLHKIEGKRRRGRQRIRLLDSYHQLTGCEFEQTPGDSEGQGSLECCSPRGHKESDVTSRLDNNYVKSNHFTWQTFPLVKVDYKSVSLVGHHPCGQSGLHSEVAFSWPRQLSTPISTQSPQLSTLLLVRQGLAIRIRHMLCHLSRSVMSNSLWPHGL